ncbi:MAG: LacI family transcriptional regulator [Cyanobacteria bacterium]|nr:LacI family transcriptional regulator [Cyanobacteriota bacterium]
MNNNKKINLKHIARLAGVSINTVSRALRNKNDISENTKKQIQQIANELDYIPNDIAGSLRKGKTKTIAIIIPDILDPLITIWVKDIESKLRFHNYNIFIINTNENYEEEEKAITLALSKKVDGLIICPTQKSNKDIIYLKKIKIPFVLIGRRFYNVETDYAISDDVRGGYLATKYLLEQGKSNILFLNAYTYISSAKERLEGYKKAFKENGLNINNSLIWEINNTSGNSSIILYKIIKLGIDFDSIFAFSDLMAWEIICFLQKEYRNILKKIIIVGYDNIQSRFLIPYSLISVNYPKRKIAHMVVDILLKKIDNPNDDQYYQNIIETNLIIRN